MQRTAHNTVLVPLLAFLLGACTDTGPFEPSLTDDPARAFRASASAAHAVTVLNWNLYIGTDVDAVITALATPDPTDDLAALQAAVATLLATDFPSRARAIADQIAAARPEVVGLQEVSTIDIDLTGIGLPIRIRLDFLPSLQAELAARGLMYDVAAIVTNVTAAPLAGVSVVDHDAILVDPSRATVTATLAQNYAANLGPVAPGVALIRGFVTATATIGGRSYTFANTHLEPDLAGTDLAMLRAAQAAELVAAVGTPTPAILMGDFNDVPGSPMHQVLTGAGFTDAWGALRPGHGRTHLLPRAGSLEPARDVQSADRLRVRAGHGAPDRGASRPHRTAGRGARRPVPRSGASALALRPRWARGESVGRRRAVQRQLSTGIADTVRNRRCEKLPVAPPERDEDTEAAGPPRRRPCPP